MAKRQPKRPTKEEIEIIERKHKIRPDDSYFEAALLLLRYRPDRVICNMPMVMCPHCGQEFQMDDYYDVKIGDVWECYKCDRPIYVEFVDTQIVVTLTNMDPNKENKET